MSPPAPLVLSNPRPPDHTSAGQVSTFRRCPRRWWIEKVARLCTPPSEAMLRGLALHDAVERYLLTGAPPPGVDPNVWAMARPGLPLLPQPPVPASLVERKLSQLRVAGVEVQGRVDLIEPSPELLLVTDHKTTSSEEWAKLPAQLATDAQAVLYAAWARLTLAEGRPVAFRHIYYRTTGGPRSWEVRTPMLDAAIDDGLDRVAVTVTKSREIGMIASLADVPPRYAACSDYGGCPHLARCDALRRGKRLAKMACPLAGERVTTQDSLLPRARRDDMPMDLAALRRRAKKQDIAPATTKTAPKPAGPPPTAGKAGHSIDTQVSEPVARGFELSVEPMVDEIGAAFAGTGQLGPVLIADLVDLARTDRLDELASRCAKYGEDAWAQGQSPSTAVAFLYQGQVIVRFGLRRPNQGPINTTDGTPQDVRGTGDDGSSSDDGGGSSRRGTRFPAAFTHPELGEPEALISTAKKAALVAFLVGCDGWPGYTVVHGGVHCNEAEAARLKVTELRELVQLAIDGELKPKGAPAPAELKRVIFIQADGANVHKLPGAVVRLVEAAGDIPHLEYTKLLTMAAAFNTTVESAGLGEVRAYVAPRETGPPWQVTYRTGGPPAPAKPAPREELPAEATVRIPPREPEPPAERRVSDKAA
ncbi:MAG: PD-(D/E)XK nuclease family protein, partial [Gemmatimonadota bacterium]